ncbi:MAG TPA: formyltransferase family protein, partial [Acidobacteriota bacterium]|nr:formyltransferase family protein [Acidobacteriota bacterium]
MLKVTVFCNSTVALPAIDWLLERDAVAGLAVPAVLSDGAFRVRNIASRASIPFLMVDRADFKEMERWLAKEQPDVAFVLTFPYRIPEAALSLPRFGFFNFHPGLLPAYRGPDPLFWEIRNQEPYGGVTVHRMDVRFDAGPIVYQEKVAILPDITYDQHLDALAEPFRKTVAWMLDQLSSAPEQIPQVPQDETAAAYQHKPDDDDLTIQWDDETADSIAALTRACHTGYGGARTYFRGMPILFHEVELCEDAEVH